MSLYKKILLIIISLFFSYILFFSSSSYATTIEEVKFERNNVKLCFRYDKDSYPNLKDFSIFHTYYTNFSSSNTTPLTSGVVGVYLYNYDSSNAIFNIKSNGFFILNSSNQLTISTSYLYRGLSFVYDSSSDFYVLDITNSTPIYSNNYGISTTQLQDSNNQCIFSTADYTYFGTTINHQQFNDSIISPIDYPSFVSNQITAISTGNAKDIAILRDYSFIDEVSDKLYFHVARYYQNSNILDLTSENYYFFDTFKSIDCTKYITTYDLNGSIEENVFISVPINDLSYNFINGDTYIMWLDLNPSINLSYSLDLPTKNYTDENGFIFYDVLNFTYSGTDNTTNSIFDYFTNRTIDSNTNDIISSSFSYDTDTELTTHIYDFWDLFIDRLENIFVYDLSENESINLTFRGNTITLNSNYLYHIFKEVPELPGSNKPELLYFYNLLQIFYGGIFSLYNLHFILYLYKIIKTGKVINGIHYDDVITTTML